MNGTSSLAEERVILINNVLITLNNKIMNLICHKNYWKQNKAFEKIYNHSEKGMPIIY